jgi:hypothetical protein
MKKKQRWFLETGSGLREIRERERESMYRERVCTERVREREYKKEIEINLYNTDRERVYARERESET